MDALMFGIWNLRSFHLRLVAPAGARLACQLLLTFLRVYCVLVETRCVEFSDLPLHDILRALEILFCANRTVIVALRREFIGHHRRLT
jgi:hypothetical protein